jgi:hypothetical protein
VVNGRRERLQIPAQRHDRMDGIVLADEVIEGAP